MPLEPKYEYSTKIYTEILCSIVAKMAAEAGEKRTSEIFYLIGKPVGEKDAKRLIPIIGVKRGNAASAALLMYTMACILGVKPVIVKYDPRISQGTVSGCIYKDVIQRYKMPLICNVCISYTSAFADAVGVNMLRGERTQAHGYGTCSATFSCANPADETVPSKARADLIIALANTFLDKNDAVVGTFSSFLVDLEGLSISRVGLEVSLRSAGNAYRGGAYQGPVFAGLLGLGNGIADAAKLLTEVRGTITCKTTTYLQTAGFLVYTRDCPQGKKCTPGGFIETACREYSRGLLSAYGNFEVRTMREGSACRQEFLQTAPKTEVKKKAG